MPRNIMVALRHPDRLSEIDLHVTNSMTGPIMKMMQKPCQELESICIGVQDSDGMRPSRVTHNTFLSGFATRLREIGLHGVALPFSEMQQVFFAH